MNTHRYLPSRSRLFTPLRLAVVLHDYLLALVDSRISPHLDWSKIPLNRFGFTLFEQDTLETLERFVRKAWQVLSMSDK